MGFDKTGEHSIERTLVLFFVLYLDELFVLLYVYFKYMIFFIYSFGISMQ